MQNLFRETYIHRGHSTTTWTNFDPILMPPPLEWTSVDILNPPPPLSTWTKGTKKPPPHIQLSSMFYFDDLVHKKRQALVFNHLLCTVIRLFIVICHDSSIPFYQSFVHVDIQRSPPPPWVDKRGLFANPPSPPSCPRSC